MFEVRWLQSATDDLTVRWTQADSELRAAITSAAHDVDRRLSRNPTREGESREGEERVFFVGPLGVLYEADSNLSQVSVIHVWVIGKRLR